MGAGRRTQSVSVDSTAERRLDMLRALSKEDLGGVIFVCNNDTMAECLSQMLFGLPRAHYEYVKNIEPGLPLFLFNYDGRLLYGIFKAVSGGGFNMYPHAWTTKHSKMSRFPSQVEVVLETQCEPLHERMFSRAISANYYAPGRFHLELSREQTRDLMRIFAPKTPTPPPAPSAPVPADNGAQKRQAPVRPQASSSWRQVASAPPPPSPGGANSSTSTEERKVDQLALDMAKMTLGSTSGASARAVGDPDEKDFKQLLDNLKVEPAPATAEGHNSQGLHIIGGFDGYRRLSSVQVLTGGDGVHVVRDAAPLLEPRSCAASAVVRGHIYVFGGVFGLVWNKSTEKYDPRLDKWTLCSLMDLGRGMLGGVALRDKIYAMGGRNCNSFYSDVECFDPGLDAWLPSAPMLEKRCSMAVAAVGESIYVLGGTNGTHFLSSVERLDPREANWSKAAPMFLKRVWFTAAALNGKIYAMGGFDGSNYLDVVECFDTRAAKWETLQPLSGVRAHCNSAVMNDAVYVVGGLDAGQRYSETVELYKPGSAGWKAVHVPGLLKRTLNTVAIL